MENKQNKYEMGFSLIYLILIVVIIIIIAKFVLAKSKDDFIKAQMNQYAKQELVIYSDTGSYAKSGDKRYPSLIQFADKINSADNFGFVDGINVAPPAFFACAVLSSNSNTYCVDSTGYKKESSKQCLLRTTANAHCTD